MAGALPRPSAMRASRKYSARLNRSGKLICSQNYHARGYTAAMSSEERGGFEVVRDGEVIRKVSRDPGVLAVAAFHHLYAERILDSGKNDDDTVWLTAEVVSGQPLSEILRVQGPLPLRRFLPLYDRVCEA